MTRLMKGAQHPLRLTNVNVRSVTIALMLISFAGPLSASALQPLHTDTVPFWQRLIRWASGSSNETPVPTTLFEPHLQMSICRSPRPGDAKREAEVIEAARRVVERYRNVADAEKAGYKPFFPRGVIGEEVHYTNVWLAAREGGTFDLDQPGSILYQRTAVGMQAVGVMYSARAEALPDELDTRAPLSKAVWHRHVNFCGGPSDTAEADYNGPKARFGLNGSISTERECTAANGYWIPLAFGWMTHIYPNHADPKKVWTGDQLMQMTELPRGR